MTTLQPDHPCLTCRHSKWRHTYLRRYFDYCAKGLEKPTYKSKCEGEELVSPAAAKYLWSTVGKDEEREEVR